MTFDAHRDWVIPNAQLDRIMQEENVRNRTYKVSKMDNMFPNFHIEVPKKPGTNKILVYNGSGGYGDQLLTWPLTLILSRAGYEVHVACDPGNQTCWWNIPWVKSINVFPMQAEHFWMFEHHLCFDTVCNMMEHTPHPHPLDVMLKKIGIDPDSIPQEQKVVRPQFTASEMNAAMNYRERTIGIYQFASANPVRNLPPQDSAFLLKKLVEAFPNVTWLAVYDEFISPDYVNSCLEDVIDPETKEPKKDDKGNLVKKVKFPNVILLRVPNLRELWAITTQAKVVVSPDSMMVHVAGSLGVPCVGLWGPYGPLSRVKYYQNHYAIHNADTCPQAPCSHYLANFPKYCPPRQGRNVCECMAAVSPPQVITGITELCPELKIDKPPPTA
jgi:ADP-heptose:LPS heptosyltransferase